VPAKTVCIDVPVVTLFPPRLHWDSICTTTPKVSHPEIDFDDPDWEPLGDPS
jgi:hypothetical protein